MTEASVTARTTLRVSHRDERGIGLVELIVAIALFAILATMLVGMFASFSQNFTKDRAATESTTVAALGMEELTRVIRSGTEIPVDGQMLNRPVFVSANAESVVLFAYLDTDSLKPAPVKVSFSINDERELVETRWDSRMEDTSFWGFETDYAWKRTIARQIVAPEGGEPSLFSYFRADGSQLDVPKTGIIPEGERRSIAAVEITMKVQADATKRAAPVTLMNRVGMPNLGVSRVGP